MDVLALSRPAAVSAPAPSKLCFAFLTISIWSCCINIRVHSPKFKVLDAQQSGCFNFISPFEQKLFFKDKSGPYIIFLLSLPASVHHMCQIGTPFALEPGEEDLEEKDSSSHLDWCVRCVCCSWCCESGRCHTSAITRLFHNTRVAPHRCQQWSST